MFIRGGRSDLIDDQIEYLMAHANRCRQLALQCSDNETKERLSRIADEHVERARKLSALQSPTAGGRKVRKASRSRQAATFMTRVRATDRIV